MHMTQPQIGSFEPIPLSAIRPSTTNPRKHFDPAALEELTQSVRELGVTVPIMVRPLTDEEDGNPHNTYEIVTGERRYRAAQNAGLETIPAIVRDELSDAEAMDLQMVENLQRADLHPVEEAEGYRALMAGGASAEDCAKKAGKTLGYVQQRLKLLSLEVDAKQLFADGHMTLGQALLLARLTPRDQQKALIYLLGIAQWEINKDNTPAKLIAGRIANAHGTRVRRLIGPTEAELREWVRSHVLLQLAGVPWDLGDAALLPIAGPCTTCPKRTGANTALFMDITTSEDTCVDPVCFGDKQKAFTLREQARAKETGSPLLKISAKASTDKLPEPVVELQPSKVVQMGEKAVQTKRPVVVTKKPVKQGQWVASEEGACPKTVQAIMVDGADQGKTKWVCADQTCKVHKHTVSRPGASGPSTNETWEQQRERQLAQEKVIVAAEEPIRAVIFREMEKAGGPGNEQFLRLLVAHSITSRNTEFVCKSLDVEFTPSKKASEGSLEYREAAEEALIKELRTRPMSFVIEACFYSLAGAALRINAWQMHRDPAVDREALWNYAQQVGVDAAAMAAEFEAAKAQNAEQEQEKPEKKKLTAAQQQVRKKAEAKKHGLTPEKRKAIADAMKKRWAENKAKVDGKSASAGAAEESVGA